MKKLRLWGWKIDEGKPKDGLFVATVYVHDGKVVIEAITPKLVQELHAAIDPGAYERGFRHVTVPHESGTFETVRDPQFLEAVIEQNGLWLWNTYDGWTIHEVLSKIVNE
jgi:hypothetical protein